MSSDATPEEAGSEGASLDGSDLGSVALVDETLPRPSAGIVLHRVLARSAHTFLLNDMDADLARSPDQCEVVDVHDILTDGAPPWARSAATALDGTQRRPTEAQRIHKSRVAMRRIRSNLRTFRLVLDPKWGTSLRAELGWYGRRLGQARDLTIIRNVITVQGVEVIAPEQMRLLEDVVDGLMAAALADIATERVGARRFQLTEQMMALWEGPAFKPKASRPADEILAPMLHRAWHDLRGAAHTARRDPVDANLHKLRIRLKDLRYGCETVALVDGGPARKTAKSAERLQSKLGDLHDASFSIEWLEDLGRRRPDLAEPIEALVTVQREAAVAARKGWKRDLKEVERRWRRWQG
jgi:CHAD domain-containing protein